LERDNPFSSIDAASLSAIIKNQEMRWGLTLVSFLSPDIQNKVAKLQDDISSSGILAPIDNLCTARKYIEFYNPEHFHCTHLTLTRSDPGGPVTSSAILKGTSKVADLYKIITNIVSKIQPITVVLDKIGIARDRLGIVLIGECLDEKSLQGRSQLLSNLNRTLSEAFSLSMRSWDNDPTQFKSVHSSIGYLKREPPQGYRNFVNQLGSYSFEPIILEMKSISLVHHKYRSLSFPQQGCVDFLFSEQPFLSEAEFESQLNIDSENKGLNRSSL